MTAPLCHVCRTPICDGDDWPLSLVGGEVLHFHASCRETRRDGADIHSGCEEGRIGENARDAQVECSSPEK